MRIADTWTTARLRKLRDLTPTIRLFEIEPEHGHPSNIPLGGHINVAVEINGNVNTRSYSLIGPPLSDAYRIAVKLRPDSHGGSIYMWSLKEGAQLTVSNPRSHFHVDFGRPDYLLIAGGIGITPIVGTAIALASSGAKLQLLYCAKSRAELAFVDELRAVLGENLRTFLSTDGQRLDMRYALSQVMHGGLTAICGPLPMLDEARRIWRDFGRTVADLRYETFGSSGTLVPQPYRVRIAGSRREIQVLKNQSMLDALEEAGIGVVSDCRRGECGVCALNIVEVEGSVDHRDVFFSERQKAEILKICACVSRATGTITIDPLLRPDRARLSH